MLLELKFSIGTLAIGVGTFGAALYGMNLKNFMEESDLGFWGVSASCLLLSVVVCSYCLTKLHKMKRVSMWGDIGRSGRSELRSLERGAHVGALGPGGGLDRRADLMEKLKRSRAADAHRINHQLQQLKKG